MRRARRVLVGAVAAVVLIGGCSSTETAAGPDAVEPGDGTVTEAEAPEGVFSWPTDTLDEWLTADEAQALMASLSAEYAGEDVEIDAVVVHRNRLQETEPPPDSRFQDWNYTSRPAGWAITVTEARAEPRWDPDLAGVPAPGVQVAVQGFGGYTFGGPYSLEAVSISVFPPDDVLVPSQTEGEDFGVVPPEMLFDVGAFVLAELGWADGSPAVLDGGSDVLCRWISPERVTEIVTEAYEAHGATPIPGDFAVAGRSGTPANPMCSWEVPGVSRVGLAGISPEQAERESARTYESHPALGDGVGVAGPLEVGDHDDFVPGLEVRLAVEGQDWTLEFWHQVPPGFDGDADAVLAIADGLLRELGWVD